MRLPVRLFAVLNVELGLWLGENGYYEKASFDGHGLLDQMTMRFAKQTGVLTLEIAVFLVLLGLAVGILAGVLGVGGGIFMVPALVFVPHIWGATLYSVHLATGISAAQALLSGLSGFWVHYRRRAVVLPVIGSLLIGSVIGGFLGGVVSGLLPDIWLYVLFAFVLLVSLISGLLHLGISNETAVQEKASFQLDLREGILIGTSISFLAANTGIGGATLLLPILIYFLRFPVRLAIGTAAGFVVFTSLSSVVGKWLMHLVPMPDALLVSAGSVVGGMIGARLSHRLPVKFLRRLLFVFTTIALVRVLMEIYLSLTGQSF